MAGTLGVPQPSGLDDHCRQPADGRAYVEMWAFAQMLGRPAGFIRLHGRQNMSLPVAN